MNRHFSITAHAVFSGSLSPWERAGVRDVVGRAISMGALLPGPLAMRSPSPPAPLALRALVSTQRQLARQQRVTTGLARSSGPFSVLIRTLSRNIRKPACNPTPIFEEQDEATERKAPKKFLPQIVVPQEVSRCVDTNAQRERGEGLALDPINRRRESSHDFGLSSKRCDFGWAAARCSARISASKASSPSIALAKPGVLA